MHEVGTKVSYDPNHITNRGSHGTTVFIGQFEDVKQVALKRFQRIKHNWHGLFLKWGTANAYSRWESICYQILLLWNGQRFYVYWYIIV